MNHYLVVGAGFTGCTIARILADAGNIVNLVECRHHIGGNAFDEYNESGILIHPYGPHIFHTNSKKVFNFLSRFTDWNKYEHIVKSSINNKIVDFPININTINELYGLNIDSPGELEQFFKERRVNHKSISNSRQYVEAHIGAELCELFFSNYTKKHWDLDLSDLSPSVAARIPYRVNFDPRYFEDKYQVMPADGYHKLFLNMLDHKNIQVHLNTRWSKDHLVENKYKKIFYSGEIDRYFDFKFGKLGYRSVQFIHETYQQENFQSAATVNYPNDKKYTRITEFKKLTHQVSRYTSIVKEIPRGEGEPYYPIPTKLNRALYLKYAELARAHKQVTFCGRLGAYKYLNMDQAVGSGISLAQKEIN